MVYLMIAAGFVLLILGGDLLVRGAVATAKKLHVSPVMIGLTLVGFGTSTPELVTTIRASLLGSAGISVGNVVGSNIANILLVLGAAALISAVNSENKKYLRDSVMVVVASAMCIATAFYGIITRPIGVMFIGVLLIYIYVAYRMEQSSPSSDEDLPKKPLIAYIALAAFGIVLTIVGADLLVRGAMTIARNFGISETVIGLTVVAVGTSLPELAATIIAAIRKQNGLAIGNIIGSNIYNLLFILGITGIIAPVGVPPEIVRVDIWVMLAATVLLVAFTIPGRIMGRVTGFSFLALYGMYIFYLARNA